MEPMLFTNNPDGYANVLVKCRVETNPDEFHRLISETQPPLILIDSALSHQIPMLTDQKDYAPTVIVSTEAMLVNFLSRSHLLQPGNANREIPVPLSKVLDTALLELCFSPSLKGYHYIKQACYYQYVNIYEISSVKKDIYEAVSTCYKTSIYSVERGITFAIRKAYAENPLSFRSMFPTRKKPPSNMAFLKTFFIYLQQRGYF